MVKRILLLIAVGLVAPGLLLGCVAGPARSPKVGPDWSRGVNIGECAFNDRVALYVEPGGQRVHLAWGRATGEGDRVRYVQLDHQGAVVQERLLPFAARSPRQVRLLPDGGDGLILCYLGGLGDSRRIFAAHLDSLGGVLAPPVPVSGDERGADEFVAVATATGAEVFWSHDGPAMRGLFHLRLDQAGRLAEPSRLLAEDGISPHAQVGQDGRLHLTWIYEPDYYEENVYYAPFDPAARELGTPVRVGYFALSPKATRFGPVLALSKNRVYIAWAWEHLAAGVASAAGEGECHYASFPFGAAGTTEVQALTLPPLSRPHYQPAHGAFAYTQLARAEGGGSGLVYMPNPAPGQESEAALAVALETATRTGSRVQIGVVYLADGAVKGYQIAGRGGTIVMRPVLAADAQSQLHLAWLEPAGAHRYRVFYATTSQAARTALGRFGRDDVIDGAYAITWGLVQSLSMFPIAFIWLAVPFAWVVGYYLVKVEGDLGRRGPRIALLVSIVLYFFCKFLLMPAGFIGAAPFLDRMSPAVADVYVLALPMAILAVALGVLLLYARRAESRTLLVGYVVFGLTDAGLTLLLYAPGVLG